MSANTKQFVFLVVLVALIGILAGVAGELWVNNFLLPSPYLSFKSYKDLANKIDELIKGGADQSEGTKEMTLIEGITRARPAVAYVYRNKNFSASPASGLTDNEAVSAAVVLTSDGWLLTGNAAGLNEQASYWVGDAAAQLYSVKKVIINKKAGVTFLKIDANNLATVELARRRGLFDGQTVFSLGRTTQVLVSQVQQKNFSRQTAGDWLRHSEDFYRFILLQDKFTNEFNGAPLFTANGKMLGFWASDGVVMPVDRWLMLLRAVIKEEKSARPYLGITFYDLSEVLNPNIALKNGVQITKIKTDSPAKGILLPLDVILKIEGEELNENKNLPELLAEFKPESVIKLLILRGQEEKEVEIKLSQIYE